MSKKIHTSNNTVEVRLQHIIEMNRKIASSIDYNSSIELWKNKQKTVNSTLKMKKKKSSQFLSKVLFV